MIPPMKGLGRTCALTLLAASPVACTMGNPFFDHAAGEDVAGSEADTVSDTIADESSTGVDTTTDTTTDTSSTAPTTTSDTSGCQDPLIDCDGICVDPFTDPDNCGGCGNGCSGDQDCALGDCRVLRYAFLTPVFYPGNMVDANDPNKLSIDGAAAHCNALAGDASLDGDFTPWLGTEADNPAAKFVDSYGYWRPDGVLIAKTPEQFLSGQLLAPIDVGPSGNPVPAPMPPECGGQAVAWTGALNDGSVAAGNCSGWVSAAEGEKGSVGFVHSTTQRTQGQGCTVPCAVPLPIYCIQL